MGASDINNTKPSRQAKNFCPNTKTKSIELKPISNGHSNQTKQTKNKMSSNTNSNQSMTYYGRDTHNSPLGVNSAKSLRTGSTYYFCPNYQMCDSLNIDENQFVEIKIIKHFENHTSIAFRLWDYHIDTDTDTHHFELETSPYGSKIRHTMAPMYMTTNNVWDTLDADHGDENFEPALGINFNSLKKEFFTQNDEEGLETWDVAIGAYYY